MEKGKSNCTLCDRNYEKVDNGFLGTKEVLCDRIQEAIQLSRNKYIDFLLKDKKCCVNTRYK